MDALYPIQPPLSGLRKAQECHAVSEAEKSKLSKMGHMATENLVINKLMKETVSSYFPNEHTFCSSQLWSQLNPSGS